MCYNTGKAKASNRTMNECNRACGREADGLTATPTTARDAHPALAMGLDSTPDAVQHGNARTQGRGKVPNSDIPAKGAEYN